MSQPRRRDRPKRKATRTIPLYLMGASIGIVVLLAVAYFVLAPAPVKITCPTGLTCAKIYTSLGVIEIELFQAQAPKTVANFVSLAKSGFYDNLVWHRIIKGFVIQTGDPLTKNGGGDRTAWGTGKSTPTVPLEVNASLHNYAGYLGMAREAQSINSGSCQFYINLVANTQLDGQYTVFAKVIGGMDVALAIADVPVNTSKQPIDPVFMTNVTILSGSLT